MSEESISTTIMNHIADIKEKLAKNTSDTQNIKDSLDKIENAIATYTALFVTQNEYSIYKDSMKDHEGRLRYVEKNVWRVIGALAILEFLFPILLQFYSK